MAQKDLNQCFEDAKKVCSELENYALNYSDGRIGRWVRIVKVNEHGATSSMTGFMKYNEMAYYLAGYITKAKNCYEPDKPVDDAPIPTDNTSPFLVVGKDHVCFEVNNKTGRFLLESLKTPINPDASISSSDYFIKLSEILHVIKNP